MTSDVPQVGLRQLSDNFQVLCPSALLPICAAGRFRRLMARDVLAVQGVHIRCFPPISKHFQAHMIVANFLSVANVVIADFLSKPTSWSSLGNLWEYPKISTSYFLCWMSGGDDDFDIRMLPEEFRCRSRLSQKVLFKNPLFRFQNGSLH